MDEFVSWEQDLIPAVSTGERQQHDAGSVDDHDRIQDASPLAARKVQERDGKQGPLGAPGDRRVDAYARSAPGGASDGADGGRCQLDEGESRCTGDAVVKAPRTKASIPHQPPERVSFLLLVVPLLIVGGLAGGGYWRHEQTEQRAATAQDQARGFQPTLRVASAKREGGPVSLTLPGATAPYDETRLYARVTGYVAERRVDIGSRVKQGDLLIRIAAPDLDAQLAQAQAQLAQLRAAQAQAHANVDQARYTASLGLVTNARTSTLVQQGWATKQNGDAARLTYAAQNAAVASAEAGVEVIKASVSAQEATVQRLQALVRFERVEAPFEGVVTTRAVDKGDLVNADASGGQPLFTVQRDTLLRVRVQVPQSNAEMLRDGLETTIQVPELPSRNFKGKVARNAVALDPAARAVLVEVDLPNEERLLRPGTYVTAILDIPRAFPGVVIPAEAVLFNGQGLRVAVVEQQGSDQVARLRDVTIARDFGTTVELRSGLQGGEQVVLNSPIDLVDGEKVLLQAPPTPPSGQDRSQPSQLEIAPKFAPTQQSRATEPQANQSKDAMNKARTEQ